MQKQLNAMALILTIGFILVILGAGIPAKSSSCDVILVPQDYATIQQAIDKANPGDTIEVASGTYNEELKITKSVRLVGDGISKTILTGDKTIIFVDADNVEIRGLSVRDGNYGIFLSYCQNAMLRDNEMSGNRWNFGVWGASVSEFVHDIDSSNKVDGKALYYWTNRNGGQVPKDAGYVALVNSTGVLVKDATLTSNEQGVLLVSTTNSIVENVTAYGNDEGIDSRWSSNNTIRKSRFHTINWRAFYLDQSHNNSIYENTVLNSKYGLLVQSSTGNTFYHNNIVNNVDQVYTDLSSNSWDNDELKEGNYWSDYAGEDLNSDGVGDTDTPWQGLDRFPLMRLRDLESPRPMAGLNKVVFKGVVTIFSANESFDDVGISEFLWDFGDGATENGQEVSHVYTEVGEYNVTLTAIDLAGKSANDSLIVTVVESATVVPWGILILGLAAGGILLAALILWKSGSSARKK
jgi:parallel beta-helix repeat protein